MVFVDTGSSIKPRGIALPRARKDHIFAFLAGALLVLSARPADGSALSEVPERDQLLPAAEEAFSSVRIALRDAEALIEAQRYDEAAGLLANIVTFDEEALEAAEDLFAIINAARTAYVETGGQVVAELNELLSADISPDQVVPTALRAYELIDRMREILPFPNEQELAVRNDLQTRILLTIDQQRFNQIMVAAQVEIDAARFGEAVRIYVEGLDDYGFDITGAVVDQGEEAESAAAQIAAQLAAGDGIRLQLGSFFAEDYPLTGTAFESARNSVESLALEGLEGQRPFVAVADEASVVSDALLEAFAEGDTERALELVAEYLPLLSEATEFLRLLPELAATIRNQEELNNNRLEADEDYRTNYHIRFVDNLTLGRPGAETDEGILFSVQSLTERATNAPIDAARDFADRRLDLAVSQAANFAWSDLTSPSDDENVTAHVDAVSTALQQAADAYSAALRIADTAYSGDLLIPDDTVLRESERYAEVLALIVAIDLLPSQARPDGLSENAARLAATRALERALLLAADAYNVALPLASTNNLFLLRNQREAVQAERDRLLTLRSDWERAVSSFDTAVPERGELLRTSVSTVVPYIEWVLGSVEQYELGIVLRLADLQVQTLERQLASADSSLRLAERDLDRVSAASGVPRPLTAAARDRLQPLVQSLQALARDAGDLAASLLEESPYLLSSAAIQASGERAREIAQLVDAPANGLLQEATTLLNRSRNQLSTATQLTGSAGISATDATARVAAAAAAVEADDFDAAAFEIGQAEAAIQRASELYAESFVNWDQPDVEASWNQRAQEINEELAQIRVDVVVVQVDSLIDEAIVLLEPEGTEDPQPEPALVLLRQARDSWVTISPTRPNSRIEFWLGQAEIALSRGTTVLRESDPNYRRLSQTLNLAQNAFEEESYETSRNFLTAFFREQPNNELARLLEIRVTLASSPGSSNEVVQSYVNTALDSLQSGSSAAAVRNQILSGQTEIPATDLIELQTRLDAVTTIVDEDDDVTISAALRQEIDDLVVASELIINPPPPPQIGNAEQERIVLAAIATAEQSVAGGSLTSAQVESLLGDLEEAQSLIAENSALTQFGNDVNSLFRLVINLAETPREFTPEEQSVFNRVLALVNAGNTNEAVQAMLQYQAAAGDDVARVPRWSRLLSQLQAIGG